MPGEIVIVIAARTPWGRSTAPFRLPAHDLGAVAIKAAR